MKVSAKARSRDDRAGEPLDGLVNLFDLGIVLSVAFLLAALSSLNLTEAALTSEQAQNAQQTRPADAVVTQEGQTPKEVELQPGEEVVGRGKAVGTVYELNDGRTIVVPSGGQP